MKKRKRTFKYLNKHSRESSVILWWAEVRAPHNKYTGPSLSLSLSLFLSFSPPPCTNCHLMLSTPHAQVGGFLNPPRHGKSPPAGHGGKEWLKSHSVQLANEMKWNSTWTNILKKKGYKQNEITLLLLTKIVLIFQ